MSPSMLVPGSKWRPAFTETGVEMAQRLRFKKNCIVEQMIETIRIV